MTETPSVTTFVVGERLPWPDDAPPLDAKGPFDLGAIHHSGSRQECDIRKISALGVTVGSDLTPALGDAVSIELANGQRAPGRVAWTGRHELGVRFDDSVDIVALLNRKLVSQTRERRTMPRLEVRCPVHLKFGGQLWPATLRNISARGVQIEGDELPPIGTFVSLFIQGLNMPAGEVLWRRDKLAGIELFEELSWTSIIPWVRGFARATVR
jgi:PilZ domain-containing protein